MLFELILYKKNLDVNYRFYYHSYYCFTLRLALDNVRNDILTLLYRYHIYTLLIPYPAFSARPLSAFPCCAPYASNPRRPLKSKKRVSRQGILRFVRLLRHRLPRAVSHFSELAAKTISMKDFFKSIIKNFLRVIQNPCYSGSSAPPLRAGMPYSRFRRRTGMLTLREKNRNFAINI